MKLVCMFVVLVTLVASGRASMKLDLIELITGDGFNRNSLVSFMEDRMLQSLEADEMENHFYKSCFGRKAFNYMRMEAEKQIRSTLESCMSKHAPRFERSHQIKPPSQSVLYQMQQIQQDIMKGLKTQLKSEDQDRSLHLFEDEINDFLRSISNQTDEFVTIDMEQRSADIISETPLMDESNQIAMAMSVMECIIDKTNQSKPNGDINTNYFKSVNQATPYRYKWQKIRLNSAINECAIITGLFSEYDDALEKLEGIEFPLKYMAYSNKLMKFERCMEFERQKVCIQTYNP